MIENRPERRAYIRLEYPPRERPIFKVGEHEMENMMEKNILIADDEDHTHRLLVKMLQGHSYRLFMAFNGKEAVEIANNNTIDLVILDFCERNLLPLKQGGKDLENVC